MSKKKSLRTFFWGGAKSPKKQSEEVCFC